MTKFVFAPGVVHAMSRLVEGQRHYWIYLNELDAADVPTRTERLWPPSSCRSSDHRDGLLPTVYNSHVARPLASYTIGAQLGDALEQACRDRSRAGTHTDDAPIVARNVLGGSLFFRSLNEAVEHLSLSEQQKHVCLDKLHLRLRHADDDTTYSCAVSRRGRDSLCRDDVGEDASNESW